MYKSQKSNDTNEVTRIETAKEFLTRLYSNTPETNFTYLWLRRGEEKITIWFKLSDSTAINSMAETAIEKSDEAGTFIAVFVLPIKNLTTLIVQKAPMLAVRPPFGKIWIFEAENTSETNIRQISIPPKVFCRLNRQFS